MSFYTYINIILLILKLSKCKEEKIIIKRYNIFYGAYCLKFTLSQDPKIMQIHVIDQSIPFNLIKNYHISKPHFISNASITLNSPSYTIPAIEGKDTFTNDNTSVTLYFYSFISNKFLSEYETRLSFAFKVQDQKFSYIHQLYNNKFISKLSYGFGGNKYGGKLYIGGFPNELVKGSERARCKVDSFESSWRCKLNYVYFGNGSEGMFNNKYKMMFQSGEYNILVPLEFIDYAKETVFKKDINRKNCRYIDNKKFNFFDCDCEVVYNLPNANFVFENKVFEFNMTDLFRFYDPSEIGMEFCECLMSLNKYNIDEWVFGISFLENFFSYFDYDREEVSFYSRESFKDFCFYSKSNYSIRIMMIIVGGMCLLNAMGLVLWKCKLDY